MKTEYIAPGKCDLDFMRMTKGKYTVSAIKHNDGYFLRFFDGKIAFTASSERWMKLPKYLLNELDNFNAVCTRLLEINQ